MGKLFLFMMISLDGYFEGKNHDLSWHNVDSEFNEFAIPQTDSVETLLFGRKTYELMRDYWPTEEARTTDPIVAKQMNTKPKVVFSKSMQSIKETEHWKNVQLVKENVVEEVENLKRNAKKDIGVYGSNNLCITLLQNNLLDEIRIMVNPVAIGKGTPLFYGIQKPAHFHLENTRPFHNGNVLLTYSVMKGGEKE